MLKKILLIAFVVILLVAAWYFLWYKPSQDIATTEAEAQAAGTPFFKPKFV